MDEFLGKKYIISTKTPSENFDEFLKFMGHGYLLRVAAKAVSPIHCLLRNADGTYTFTMDCKLINTSVTFRLDEEFEEKKPGPYDEKLKSLMTIEGNVLIHRQTEENGRTATHCREFFADRMITRTSVSGWDKVLTRYYDLMES